MGQKNLTLESYVIVPAMVFGGFRLSALDLPCSQLMALVAPLLDVFGLEGFVPFLSLLTPLLGITEKAKQA